LHAFSAVGLSDPLMPVMINDLQGVNDQAVADHAGKIRAFAVAIEAEIDTVAAFGPLSSIVHDMVRERSIDLVVMGSGGREGRSFLGSNTTSVMQAAQAPVLELPDGLNTLRIGRILFADDRSSIRSEAIAPLAEIARMTSAEIVIAHVATGKPAHEQEDHSTLFPSVFNGIPLRTRMVENDNVEEALFDLAEREQVDLIALLHRHHGLWADVFGRSTTKDIALHSTLPVLALEQ
jgi:nucleotide-binding universal stress UspA family protein